MSTLEDQQSEVRLEMEKDNKTNTNLMSSEKERELRDFLRQDYRKHYLRVRLAPLLKERHEHPRTVDEMYVPVLKTLLNQEKVGTERQHQYGDILDEKLNDGSSDIYIVGDAGMGKTILCRKILSTWCKLDDEDFDEQLQEKMTQNNDTDKYQDVTANTLKKFPYVFYISLRNIHRGQSVEDMIVNQLLEGNHSETFYHVIETYPGKCLFIIDGLDEWKSSPSYLAIPKREFKCLSLFTTRRWKMEEIRQESKGNDIEIGLSGFDDQFAELFIKSVIEKMNSESNKKTVEHFYSKCEFKPFQGNPMLLKFMTCVWHNTGKAHTSITELYLDIVEWNFKDIFNHMSGDYDGGPTVSMLPELLQERKIFQKFEFLLTNLGRFCFTFLSRALVFTKEDLSKFGMTSDEINMAHQLGVRSIASVDGRSTEKKDLSISCIHKTFQELFAALYVAQNPKELKKLINKGEIARLSFILQFINGFNSNLLQDTSNFTPGKQTYPLKVRSSTETTSEQKPIVDETQNCVTSVQAHDWTKADLDMSLVEETRSLEQSSSKDSDDSPNIQEDVISMEDKREESDRFDESPSLVSNYKFVNQTDELLANSSHSVGAKDLTDFKDSADVGYYEPVYQADVVWANNAHSGDAKGQTLVEHMLPFKSWYAYDYSCKHIESLYIDYRDMLKKCGLHETTALKLFEERLYKTVSLVAIGDSVTDMVMKNVGSQNGDHLTKPLDPTSEFRTKMPLVVVAFDHDVDQAMQLCQYLNLDNQGCFIVLIKGPFAEQVFKSLSFKSTTHIRMSITSPESLQTDIDDLLERYAFDSVHYIAGSLNCLTRAANEMDTKKRSEDEPTYEELFTYAFELQQDGFGFTTTNSGLERSDVEIHLEQLQIIQPYVTMIYVKIESMYRRSKIPAKEKAILVKKTTVRPNKQTFRDLLDIDTVAECGEKNSVIHVHFQNDASGHISQAAMSRVEETLKGRGHNEYIFRSVPDSMKPLYKVGETLGNVCRGTLGGFATDSNKLYALLSRHVAELHVQKNETVLSLGKTVEGHILQPFAKGNRTLDIAAAHIKENHVSLCETSYKDENGKETPCLTFDFKNSQIENCTEFVHIWGAVSKPGLGEIDLNFAETQDNGTVLTFTDRKRENGEVTPFCQRGDSGAIILGSDRDGTLYAIAMLIGENLSRDPQVVNPTPLYIAFPLQDGLEQLSDIHNVEMRLCDQKDNRPNTVD